MASAVACAASTAAPTEYARNQLHQCGLAQLPLNERHGIHSPANAREAGVDEACIEGSQWTGTSTSRLHTPRIHRA